jgi:hypothetical protein
MCKLQRLSIALLVSLLGLSAAIGVMAHGIGLAQVVNVQNGPYLISAWTDPDPLREDETHIVIAVMDPATRAPLVQDVAVAVRMEKLGDPEATLTVLSDSGNSANQLLYVVEFNDQVSAGDWQATVIIDGPLGMAEDVKFPLEITSAQGFNWLWLGIAGLGIAVILWLVLASRRPASAVTVHGRESAKGAASGARSRDAF